MPCDTQALHASCFSLNRLRLYGYISICAITHTTLTSVPRTPMPSTYSKHLSLTGGLTPLTPNAEVEIGALVRVKRGRNGAGLQGRVVKADHGRIAISREVNGRKAFFYAPDTWLQVVTDPNAKEPKKLKVVMLDKNTPMHRPRGGWNNPYRRGAEVMVLRDLFFEGEYITGWVIKSYKKRVIIFDREHGVRYSAPYYWFGYRTTESRFFCEVSTALDAWNDAKMQHTTAASVRRGLRARTRTHEHNLRPRRDAAGGLTH
jgi:hypothetical protein